MLPTAAPLVRPANLPLHRPAVATRQRCRWLQGGRSRSRCSAQQDAALRHHASRPKFRQHRRSCRQPRLLANLLPCSVEQWQAQLTRLRPDRGWAFAEAEVRSLRCQTVAHFSCQ